MPKVVTPLTDAQVKIAKTKDKPYKLSDGGGLYLEVMPTGSKLRRMKFKRTIGKESRLAFGSCPEAPWPKQGIRAVVKVNPSNQILVRESSS